MKKLAVLFGLFLMPSLALAQYGTGSAGGGAQDASGILSTVLTLVDQATFVIVAIAILVFIYGIVRYVIANNEEAKANAQRLILYGVIGLFAIVAVWGLVNFLANTTGIGSGVDAPELPCAPGFGC
jgi:uncharacterized membrane protein HdeD (DUF308 family)